MRLAALRCGSSASSASSPLDLSHGKERRRGTGSASSRCSSASTAVGPNGAGGKARGSAPPGRPDVGRRRLPWPACLAAHEQPPHTSHDGAVLQRRRALVVERARAAGGGRSCQPAASPPTGPRSASSRVRHEPVGDADRLRRVDVERRLPGDAAGVQRDVAVIPRAELVLRVAREGDERADRDAVVGERHQRCSGFGKSKRQPASHCERWLPCAGIPPASLSMRARCSRFHVMKVVLRFVKSFSGPPEPGSR